MVRDFDNHFREYLDNLKEEALKELRSDNYAFLELEAHQNRLYEKVNHVIETLPTDNQKLVNEFIDAFGVVAGQEADYMYYQGLKDSIRFLKFLQVI